MIRYLLSIFLLSLLVVPVLAQPEPCDPPLVAAISSNAPVCIGSNVNIVFLLPPDDDGEGYDVSYSIGGTVFTLSNISNNHVVSHSISANTTATLIRVENNDDDDDECYTDFNQTISINISVPTLTISNQNNPSCGINNGSITISASSGINPYRYNLNGGAYQSGTTFSGLGAGSYIIGVLDNIGCSAQIATELQSPNAPTASISGQNNPSCGQNNGSITASATGGTPPYQYSLNGGPFQSSPNFGNLPAGNYSVRVRDANNCEDSASTDLLSSNSPNAAISSQNNPACGQNNGSITASATGGTPPYQYSLNGGPFQSSPNFGNLPAGNYSVRVRDANNCEDSASTDLFSSNSPNAAISSQNNPACGQNNGSITASATGGTPPYQYSLNGGPFQSSPNFGNLPAGNYSVRVRDANNCEDSASTDLLSSNSPNAAISSQNNPSCGQNNGSITASATGGTPPYQYSLNGGPFQSSPNFGNLPAGNYSVRVRDANNCEDSASTDLLSSNSPNAAISSQNNPACGQNNGSITASATGGTPPYQYSLNGGPFQSSPNFGNLPAGNYSVRVRDANNCEDNVSTDLLSNNSPNAAISSQNNPACGQNNGSITASATGGTPPYQYSLNGGPFQSSPNFGNLPAGNYSVRVRDAKLCISDKTTMLENLFISPNANSDGPFIVKSNQNIEVPILLNDAFSGQVSLNITKNPSQGSITFKKQNILTYEAFASASEWDTVKYEICSIECPDSCDDAEIWFRNQRLDDPCQILGDTSNVFTNGITPNMDGNNDYLIFRVVSVEDCEVNQGKSEIIIYNRWGDIVYEQSPYENKWAGTSRDGDDLPPGVYYFVLRITTDRVYTQFGSVIIIR